MYGTHLDGYYRRSYRCPSSFMAFFSEAEVQASIIRNSPVLQQRSRWQFPLVSAFAKSIFPLYLICTLHRIPYPLSPTHSAGS
jgi:hypothetical protein